MGALLDQLKADVSGIEDADEDYVQMFRWRGVVLKGHANETSENLAMRDAGFEQTADIELTARADQFVSDPQPDDDVLMLGDRPQLMRVAGPVKRSQDGVVMMIVLRRQNAGRVVAGGYGGEGIVMPDGMQIELP